MPSLRKQIEAEWEAHVRYKIRPARRVTDRTLGIDVSAAQGANLDWKGIAASGVKFAFCKATEAQGYTDPTFEKNVAEAKAAGILVGSYHFFWPSKDAILQAEHYFKVAGSVCDLPPVMDWETTKGVPGEDMMARVAQFVRRTDELWGKRCIVYSYPSFLFERKNAKDVSAVARYKLWELAERELWIAHYGVASPNVPDPFKRWTFWQFDGDGGKKLPQGIDADFNWFAGTEEQLQAYVAKPDEDPFKKTNTLLTEKPVEQVQRDEFIQTLADC